MDIVVHDTISVLQPLFTLRERPKVVFERAQKPMLGSQGLINWIPKTDYREHNRGGYPVMQAVRQDGYDVMVGQQMWGLFDPGRSKDASDWQFAQFVANNVQEQLRIWLQAFEAELPLLEGCSRLECMLLPADPANQNLMIMNRGLSGFGGLPGHLFLQVWPGPGNLARMGPALARLFAQNIRWQLAREDREITLADFLALEGLSAVFVESVFPAYPAPWHVAFHEPADWATELADVARLHGVANYDEMKVNIYGMRFLAGSAPRPPVALPLENDELAYTTEVLHAALMVTDARQIAAYLYGDELAALNGHSPAGLSPYAGFEAAYRLMRAYLQRTGQTPGEALLQSTRALFASEIQ